MITPAAPPMSPLRLTLSAIFLVAVYIWSWWIVFHPPEDLNLGPFLVGLLLFPVIHVLSPRWRLPVILVAVAWCLFGGEVAIESFTVGWACFLLVLLTVGAAVALSRLEGPAQSGEDVGLDALLDTPADRIIALSGYAGSGKDTAALGLLEDGWVRVAFGDKLREFALAINPIVGITNDERLNDLVTRVGWTEAKRNPEVRRLLQVIGTDAGRRLLGENVWVDAVMSDLPEGDVVITDCRFPNEAQAVKAAGGHVVRVERPMVDAVNSHPSETALDGWGFDAYLNNDMEAASAGHRLRGVAQRLYGA